MIVLVHFLQVSQNTTDWVMYEWKKFISHSSKDWEVQEHGASIWLGSSHSGRHHMVSEPEDREEIKPNSSFLSGVHSHSNQPTLVITALIHSWRQSPHVLIISERFHLPIPLHWQWNSKMSLARDIPPTAVIQNFLSPYHSKINLERLPVQ